MKEIIACIDGSHAAEAVCQGAAWAASVWQAPVCLLHVLDHTEYPTEGDLSGSIGLGSREQLLKELADLDNRRSRLALQEGKLQLHAAEEQMQKLGETSVTTLQRHGSLLETLFGLAEQMRLLVIGRQGEAHENEREGIGSHLESVIRAMHCPILVMVPQSRAPDRFMIAYDGSRNSREMLKQLGTLSLLQGKECHLVMAGEDSATQEHELTQAAEQLKGMGFSVRTARVPGETIEALTSYSQAHEMDLMVMGAYGHSRIRQFLVGSTTTAMLNRTSVPLLLLR